MPVDTSVSSATLTALGNYGELIGLAYQLRDDVIDLIGDPALTGKPWAGDLKTKKMRLPLIRLLSVCSAAMRSECAGILAGVVDDAAAARLRDVIISTRSLEYCMAATRRLCEQSVAALSTIEDHPATGRLKALAELVGTFE